MYSNVDFSTTNWNFFSKVTNDLGVTKSSDQFPGLLHFRCHSAPFVTPLEGVFTWLLTPCSSSGTPGLSPASRDPLLAPPLHLNLLVLMYLVGSVPGSPPSFVNTHSLSDNIHSHSLNTTNTLIIPKFLSVCLTFPLNSKITYPNAFLSLQLGCLPSHINTSKSEILIFSSQNALLTVSYFPVDSYSILPGTQANVSASSFDVSLSLISYYNL